MGEIINKSNDTLKLNQNELNLTKNHIDFMFAPSKEQIERVFSEKGYNEEQISYLIKEMYIESSEEGKTGNGSLTAENLNDLIWRKFLNYDFFQDKKITPDEALGIIFDETLEKANLK